jgi:NitT/TauT family transport system permease protein
MAIQAVNKLSPLLGGQREDPRTDVKVVYTGARTQNPILLLVLRLGLVAILIGAWQLGSDRVFSSFFFSKPSAIAEALAGLVASGTLVRHALITFQEAATGYVLGSLIGISVGFLFGRVRLLGEVIEPLIVAIFSIPNIAKAPLIILWFGIDLAPKIVLASLSVFFAVFYVTYGAAKNVPTDLMNVVAVMRGSRWQMYREVIIPSSLGFIYVGLGMAVPHAILATVAAEILSGNQGLGYLVSSSTAQFAVGRTFAVMVVLALLGVVINRTVAYTGRKIQKWNPNNG